MGWCSGLGTGATECAQELAWGCDSKRNILMTVQGTHPMAQFSKEWARFCVCVVFFVTVYQELNPGPLAFALTCFPAFFFFFF